MIDKLGLDGLGGASVRVEPTPQEQKVTPPVDGQSKSAFTPSDGDTPAVVGLEPVATVSWAAGIPNTIREVVLHDFNLAIGTKLCLAATVERLVQERDKYKDSVEHYGDLYAKLAASQAREQQLREVLKKIQFGNTKFDRTGDSQDYCPECNGTAYTGHDSGCFVQKALALPQDDTALREWGANLLEEMAMEIDLGTQETEDAAITLCRKAAELREGK